MRGQYSYLGGVGRHVGAQAHGDTAYDQAGVVEVQTVDALSITQPTQDEPGDGVGNAYDGYQEGSIVLFIKRPIFLDLYSDSPLSGSVHSEDVGSIEADAREEVTDGVHHEDGVLEQTKVHHPGEDGRPLGLDSTT